MNEQRTTAIELVEPLRVPMFDSRTILWLLQSRSPVEVTDEMSVGEARKIGSWEFEPCGPFASARAALDYGIRMLAPHRHFRALMVQRCKGPSSARYPSERRKRIVGRLGP